MVTSSVTYEADMRMWRVLVWVDGVVQIDQWFHTESIANLAEATQVARIERNKEKTR